MAPIKALNIIESTSYCIQVNESKGHKTQEELNT